MARVLKLSFSNATRRCGNDAPTMWYYSLSAKANGSFFDNAGFNMSRTRILWKYKKKAIHEMYIVLEFKIDTMRSFKDTNFYIY